MKAKSSRTQAGDTVSFIIECQDANNTNIYHMRRAKGIVLKVNRDNMVVIENLGSYSQQQTWTVSKSYVRRCKVAV